MSKQSPVSVVGLSSGVVAITLGGKHTCALLGTGTLKAWGDNQYGQLGTGGTSSSTTAVDVTAGLSAVTSVSAGGYFTCAIAAGALYCWGDNAFGQLGLGSTAGKVTPQPLPGMGSGVTAIALGRLHSCAVKSSVLYCWGGNTVGAVGDGSIVDRWSPVAITSVGSVRGITAGGAHSCALSAASETLCWCVPRENAILRDCCFAQPEPVLTPRFLCGLLQGFQFLWAAGNWEPQRCLGALCGAKLGSLVSSSYLCRPNPYLCCVVER